MSEIKSPFIIIQDFVSPAMCEQILRLVGFTAPDTDTEGNPIPSYKNCDSAEQLIFSTFSELVPEIERYYELKYKGTEKMVFEWYPEGSAGYPHKCESSKFLRKKWLKTAARDISCLLFLNDFQDKSPFDPSFEVFGGKIEFPQYDFSLQPQRGTLVIFPSSPHFLNAMTPITLGNNHLVRFHIAAEGIWLYDGKKFPGNFKQWFETVA